MRSTAGPPTTGSFTRGTGLHKRPTSEAWRRSNAARKLQPLHPSHFDTCTSTRASPGCVAEAAASALPWAPWAALVACGTLGMLAERLPAGRLMTGPVCAMLLASLATNLGLMPHGTAAALPGMQLFLVKLATPLLLYGADLRQAWRGGRRLLPAFALATVGTLAGALAADLLLHAQLGALGNAHGDPRAGFHLAAALAAKNIGGSVNYIAVATALELPRPLFSAGIAVDNLAALVYFPLVSALGSQPWFVQTPSSSSCSQDNSAAGDHTPEASTAAAAAGPGVSAERAASEPLMLALALSFLIAAAAEQFGKAALVSSTVVTLALATARPTWMSRLAPHGRVLGNTLLFVFFASAGVAAGSLGALLGYRTLLSFLLVLYGVHLAVLLVVGRGLLRMRGAELLVASHANIGSAATVACLAGSKGWGQLLVPGILAANLGNALATFIGILLSRWLTNA